MWHVEVPDLNPDLLYGYRVTGPNEPHKGQRYKKELVVVDPYAKVRACSPPCGRSPRGGGFGVVACEAGMAQRPRAPRPECTARLCHGL